jgi:hypothetical protein
MALTKTPSELTAADLTITTAAQPNITSLGTLTTLTINGAVTINESSADVDVRIETSGDTHRLFIDGGNDRILIGTTASVAMSGVTPSTFLEGTAYASSTLGMAINANGTNESPLLMFGKSRGTSLGSNTIVQNGDRLFSLRVHGSDGTNQEQAALIEAHVDAAPANNSVPGRLSFWTTNDGAQYATEKMRIDNAGNVGIGVTSPSTSLDIVRAGVQPLRLESSSGTEVAINMVNTGGNVQLEAHSGNFVIDADAVGIGVTPAARLHAYSNSAETLRLEGNDEFTYLSFKGTVSSSATSLGLIGYANQSGIAADLNIENTQNGGITFATNNTIKMTMHSTGLVSVGTTGQHGASWTEALHIQGNNTRSNALFLTGYSGSAVSGYQSGSTSNAVNFLYFINSAGTNVGSIQISNSNTATTVSYNTSSDHRLKENVTYDWDGLTKLKQLKPAQFNFKADPDTTIDGFLAHEAQTVVPEAVTGTHNETEDVSNAVLNALGNVIDEGVTEDEWKAGKEAEEGKEPKYAADTVWKAEHTKDVYQGIDQSKLVPLMVKAIQELEAKVKALEEA